MGFRKFPRKTFHSHLTLQQPRPVIEVCSDHRVVRTVDFLSDSKQALVQRFRLLVLALKIFRLILLEGRNAIGVCLRLVERTAEERILNNHALLPNLNLNSSKI